MRRRLRTFPALLLVGLLSDGAGAWVTTEEVSRRPDGAPSSDSSFDAAISSDGRWVAFASYAGDFVAGDTNGRGDVYVRDRQTGTVTRESLATDGAEGNEHSAEVALSSDGAHVAFRSRATNLVPDDTNGWADVFVRDRETGVLERVSVGAPAPDWDAYAPSISRDGQVVAFV